MIAAILSRAYLIIWLWSYCAIPMRVGGGYAPCTPHFSLSNASPSTPQRYLPLPKTLKYFVTINVNWSVNWSFNALYINLNLLNKLCFFPSWIHYLILISSIFKVQYNITVCQNYTAITNLKIKLDAFINNLLIIEMI